jgi:lipopolysaccharide biosynthesis protein
MPLKIKPIAIYLPQFHPILENDHWWGKGFTEWTNVTKAKPFFKGHYQPHLPSDLGFYDLRLEEARLAQEAMAKKYGIHGFCYYHYWFNGKQVLDTPLKKKLQNDYEDLPFMLCWANENWTRKWDGGNNEVLLEQNYTKQDANNFAKHLIPFLMDKRYIKNQGKALFAIYRSELILNIDDYIEAIHLEASKINLEVEICRFESFGNSGVEFMGKFDSAIEFQPFSEILLNFRKDIVENRFFKKIHYRVLNKLSEVIGFNHFSRLLTWSHFNKLDYLDYVQYIIKNYKFKKEFKRYPSVMPSWDNSARRLKYDSFLFYNSTPEYFELWLEFIFSGLEKFENKNLNGFVFVNAWNEWAEGNHLEPCQKWGKKYLEKLNFKLNDCTRRII